MSKAKIKDLLDYNLKLCDELFEELENTDNISPMQDQTITVYYHMVTYIVSSVKELIEEW